MSATRPVPKITGAPGTAYPYSETPLAPLALSASTSEPSTGPPAASAITAWLWTLAEKPVGSAAAITNATSENCSLDNIDLPGTYVVHLKVTDDEGRESFDKWYPKQDGTSKVIETYEATAVVEIVMETEFLELEVPGSFSRNYTAKLNEALHKLDDIGGAVTVESDHSTASLKADEINEWTTGAGVTVDGVLIKDSSIDMDDPGAAVNVDNGTELSHVTPGDALFQGSSPTVFVQSTDGTNYVKIYGATGTIEMTGELVLPGSVIGLREDRTVYVQAQDGSADADGSFLHPFNPVSAAANAFAGPWAQAVAALQAADISDTPGAPRSIVAAGTLDNFSVSLSSAYDEDVSITADGPWNIVFTGLAVFAAGRSITYIASATPQAPPNLFIGGTGALGIASSVMYAPTISLRSDAASTWLIRWEGVAADAVDVDTAVAASPLAFLRNCLFDTFVVPNLEIRSAVNTRFLSTLTVELINEALHCQFDDVTLTAVGGAVGGPAGFYSCLFDASGVFTAPAGAALFDPLTAENFEASGCSYSGGAGVDDHLNISAKRVRAKQELRTPAIYDNGGSGDLLISAEGSVGIVSNGGTASMATSGPDGTDVDVLAVRDVDIDALAGDVDITSTAAGVGVLSGATFTDDGGGNVLVTYAGHGAVNGQLVLVWDSTSYNGVWRVSDAASDTFKLKHVAADGTNAVGDYVTYSSDRTGDVYRGGVDINTNALSAVAGSMTLHTDEGSFVVMSANFALLRALSGRVMLQAQGTGGTIELDAADGVRIETDDGTIDILAKGANQDLSIVADDGDVYVNGGNLGTGNVYVNSVGGAIVLNGVNAATLVEALYQAWPNQPTTGTTKQLLDSYEIAAGKFATAGRRIRIEAFFHGENNGNNKLYEVELEAVTIATLATTSSQDEVSFVIDLWAVSNTQQRFKCTARINDVHVVTRGTAIINMGSARTLSVYGTTSGASGDLTLDHWHVTFHPEPA